MWPQPRFGYNNNNQRRHFNPQMPHNFQFGNGDRNWNNSFMNMMPPNGFQDDFRNRNFRPPRMQGKGRKRWFPRGNQRNTHGRDDSYMVLDNNDIMNPLDFDTRSLGGDRDRLSRSGSLPPFQDMGRRSLNNYDFMNDSRLNVMNPSTSTYKRGSLPGNQRDSSLHSHPHSHSMKKNRRRSTDSVCSDIYDNSQRLNDSYPPSPPPFRRESFSDSHRLSGDFSQTSFKRRPSSQCLSIKNEIDSFEKSPPLVHRTIRSDNKRDRLLDMEWSDDSDNDRKHINEEDVKLKSKGTADVEASVWDRDEESDTEGDKFNDQVKYMVFKYSSDTLPQYDGKTVVGNEGVFEVKVFRCAFCNIICMDKERSKLHLLTKYHHRNYRDYIKNWEIEKSQKKE